MKDLPINICPLLAIAGVGGTNNPAVCIEDRCAWWTISHCAVLDITFSLDELVQKEAVVSVRSTDDGKVEQISTAVSTSTITENGGNVK